MSSVSHNFDEELKMRFGMDEMVFMRLATTRRKFCQDCTKYNNLFAMAATKVCSYCVNSGFTNQGPGHHSVMLSGRVHHFFTRVSSSNPQSCGLSYFVFDSSASCACLSKSGNVDEELLNDIGNGLKNEKGSTKCTLCGIVLFKLNMFLVMFSRVPFIDIASFPRTLGL